MTTRSEGMMMMIQGKLKWYAILVLALWLAFSGVATGEQLYVNEGGWWRDGGMFNVSTAPIQAAVDNATAGDSVFVRNGNYAENVNVCTAHLTLVGEGADVVTVTAAELYDHVFTVAADYVNISGFTVTRTTTCYGYVGIYLNCADHCNISENIALNNGYGIRLEYSSNNALANNTANSNDHGIWLLCSSNNMLTNNKADSNNGYGICLGSSSNNADSSNNTLANNNASGNCDGIYLWHSSNNTLANNNADSNNYYGIWLQRSSNNTLANNNASNNGYGIHMWHSSNNLLANNNADSNNGYGIYLWNSSNNNNILNNTVNSNNEHGIYVRNADNNNIFCNWVSNNTKQGFYLTDGSTDNTIENNNIMSNGISIGGGVYHWNFCNDQADDVEAKNNYWGATDNNTIDASIYDCEEGEQGDVKFCLFETEPVHCAPTLEGAYTFTIADAVIVLQSAAGSRPLDLCWDVSGDGSVTSLDALMVMQAAAGDVSL